MKTIPLTQGKYALIDDKDYGIVSLFKWHAHKDDSTFYAHSTIGKLEGCPQTLLMHRLIMNAGKGVQVDHMSHDGLDNRKSNLRLCTDQQNKMNVRHRKNTTSKYKGVLWNERNGVWIARIGFNGSKKHIGHFHEERAAAQAYDIMARKLFGEFAYYNNVGVIKELKCQMK